MSTFTLRLAINGSETDEDVEIDSADWTSKVANLSVSCGGGSWWKTTNPAALRIDLDIPFTVAARVRTATVAVEGPWQITPQDWHTDNGDGTVYRVIFHGDVVAVRGAFDDTLIGFDFVDEMNGLQNRRARTALANNSGVKGLLNDIASAHSLTISGSDQFPTDASLYNLDRPAQKGAANGRWIETALVGTGQNLVGDWDGPIDSPELWWRPDYFDGTATWAAAATRRHLFTLFRPWHLQYPDVGIAWQDFVASVNVDGENSAGDRKYGTAELSAGAYRRLLGYREINLTSWIDTAGQCEAAALRLIRRVGEPRWLKTYRAGAYVDDVFSDADNDVTFTYPYPDVYAMNLLQLMPGDEIGHRLPFDDSNGLGGDNVGGFWPAICPEGSARYDELEALWAPTIESDGEQTPVQYHVCRSVTRTWTPPTGWYVEWGMEPTETIDATGFNTSSGSY